MAFNVYYSPVFQGLHEKTGAFTAVKVMNARKVMYLIHILFNLMVSYGLRYTAQKILYLLFIIIIHNYNYVYLDLLYVSFNIISIHSILSLLLIYCSYT